MWEIFALLKRFLLAPRSSSLVRNDSALIVSLIRNDTILSFRYGASAEWEIFSILFSQIRNKRNNTVQPENAAQIEPCPLRIPASWLYTIIDFIDNRFQPFSEFFSLIPPRAINDSVNSIISLDNRVYFPLTILQSFHSYLGSVEKLSNTWKSMSYAIISIVKRKKNQGFIQKVVHFYHSKISCFRSTEAPAFFNQCQVKYMMSCKLQKI